MWKVYSNKYFKIFTLAISIFALIQCKPNQDTFVKDYTDLLTIHYLFSQDSAIAYQTLKKKVNDPNFNLDTFKQKLTIFSEAENFVRLQKEILHQFFNDNKKISK